MANRNQVVGQVIVEVDGERYPTSGDSSMQIGGKQRENVPGDYEAGSFMEKTVPSRTTVGLLHKDGVSLTAMQNIDNGTLTLRSDTGKTWVVRSAYFVEASDFSQDGKAQVVFEGQPAEELL
ncbi:phage tail tube protein [Citromicrobium bathyomarinum]|uniref:phage tail tube protein n=1 Tax=Citromicrobium bathyomarinum TaxID=72174 RepID=UPI00315A7F05